MGTVKSVAVIGNHWGTAVRFRGKLIQAILVAGIEVHVVGPMGADAARGTLENWGVKTHAIPLSRSGKNISSELVSLYSLYRTLRHVRPDILLCYFAKPVIYGSIIGWLARVPERYSLIAGLGHVFSGFPGEASTRRRILAFVVRTLYRLALGRNQCVFFQNHDDAEFFVRFGVLEESRAVIVNGSGVDLRQFRQSEPVTDPVTFLLAARLIVEKGVRDYIAAATILRERGYEARFILLGGIDDNPSRIRREEIEDAVDQSLVEWPGMVDDVVPWLDAASVYVLPTYYREGIPRSIQEAMAVGRAVITTETPGCRETVEPGCNGFLVAPRDPRGLADAMERYLQDSEAICRHGQESRRLAEHRFDVDRINEKMLGSMGLVPSAPLD